LHNTTGLVDIQQGHVDGPVRGFWGAVKTNGKNITSSAIALEYRAVQATSKTPGMANANAQTDGCAWFIVQRQLCQATNSHHKPCSAAVNYKQLARNSAN